MNDLFYFGHDGRAERDEFRKVVGAKFPPLELKDDNDPYKGKRLVVDGDVEADEFYPFVLSHGYFDNSLACGIMSYEEEGGKKLKDWIREAVELKQGRDSSIEPS